MPVERESGRGREGKCRLRYLKLMPNNTHKQMENEPWRTVVLVSKHALEMEIDCAAAAAAAVDAMRSESIPFPVHEAKANKDSVKDHVQTHTDTHAHIHT